MDVQPDCGNPSTGSAAGEPQQYGELPLNGARSATEVGDPPDPRIGPEVDSLSIFVSEQASPGRCDSVPPAVLAQAQPPRADVASPAKRPDDRGRSWLWRLRSLKASRETRQPQRGAHAEPVTTEAISQLEKHLAALATLPDLCARINQRLARVEAVSGRIDGDTIDEALDDLRTQIDDRLVRVEAALQHTDVADRTLCELCEDIDARLVRTEDTLRRTEGIVAGWLQRLAEAEETIQRVERVVSSTATEQTPSQRPAVRIDDRPVQTAQQLERLLGDVPADVDLRSRSYATTGSGERADRGVLRPFVNIKQTIRVVRLPMVLVAAVAVGAMIWTSRGATPETGVSLASTNQMSISAAPATTPGGATLFAESVAGQPRASTTALRANAPPSTGGERVFAPEQGSGDRKSAAIASRPGTFVGTLPITSIPPAAGFRDLSKTSASSAASTRAPDVAPLADSSTAKATDAASPVRQRETPLPPAPPQVTEQIGQKLVSTQDVPPSSPVAAKMKASSFSPGQPDSDLSGPTAQPESALGQAPVDAFLAPRSFPAVTPPSSETGAVQSVLHRFQRAYTDLNAGVVKAVWPSVDEKTLRRAFDQLEQQEAVFDGCRIDVTGVRAVAACDGYSRYVPKVGSKTPQIVSRHWRFTLEKPGSEWTIRTVEFR